MNRIEVRQGSRGATGQLGVATLVLACVVSVVADPQPVAAQNMNIHNGVVRRQQTRQPHTRKPVRPQASQIQKQVQQRVAKPSGVLHDLFDPNAPAIGSGPLTQANIEWHGSTTPREFLRLDQYTQIRDASLELLRRFDPSKHTFIGLGRSPTTIVAFLQNLGLGAERALNIPASGMRKRNPDSAAWDQHLAQFFPLKALTSARDVVVFDRTSSGSSLIQAQQLLSDFLTRRGSGATVKLLAFSSHARHPELASHPQIGPNRINIDEATTPELYEMNRYSHWAEYGHHIVGGGSSEGLTRRPEYEQYKGLLAERMKRDAALSAAIQEINGIQ